jgi:shikimate 5-dehydrogenase
MIGKDTALYSIIGESAIEAKKESLFNDIFKDKDLDMMVMPLNIRDDDLGFFLYNFKNSKVKGAYFLREYWQKVCSLLADEVDEEAKICGIVDSLDIKDGKNKPYVVQGRAIVSLLDLSGKRVGVCGDSPTIKSALYHLNRSDLKEIIFFDDIIERTLDLISIVPDKKSDVVRIENGMIDDDIDILILDRDDIKYNLDTKVLKLYRDSLNDGSLDFSDVEREIAKIKTREWIENG